MLNTAYDQVLHMILITRYLVPLTYMTVNNNFDTLRMPYLYMIINDPKEIHWIHCILYNVFQIAYTYNIHTVVH